MQARGPGGENLEVSSTYRQAVATETPKPTATCANVSLFRRRASARRACLKQLSLRQGDFSSRRRAWINQETCSTSSCGTSSVEEYGTNRAPRSAA